MSISIAEFLDLRKELAVIDVRSEGEYHAGHVPGAVNIPILDNTERAIVGTIYKQRGQQEAIQTGHALIEPRLEKILTRTQSVAQGKPILVHCWRGGMRSAKFCQFVAAANIETRSLDGGYKSYRNIALESFRKPLLLRLITGFTGSGKSEVLRAIAARGEQILDLEVLASHKGSVFGGLGMEPQPTTEQFQNDLFEELLKLDTSRRIWVEDESLSIGKIFLPVDFWTQMEKSPLVEMDVAKGIRVARLANEYGTSDRTEFLRIMGKIVKRLGGQHYKAACEKLEEGDMVSVVDILLTYYDKAYEGSIGKRRLQIKGTIAWDGGNPEVCAGEVCRCAGV